MREITESDIHNFLDNVDVCFQNGEIRNVTDFLEKYPFNSQLDTINMENMITLFFYTWKNMECIHSDITLYNMIKYIFMFEEIHRDLNFVQQNIPLHGKKILDTGSCWGSLALALRKYTNDIFCIDHVYEHSVFAKIRIPGIRSFQGDVRNMHLFQDGMFDVVLSRGVVEHVGDYSTSRGPADATNYGEKLKYLSELQRVLKDDGYVWLSTGNFAFPRDGEISQWFTHWLNGKNYQKYLEKTGRDADKYWLLTWRQMENLVRDAHLRIVDVVCPDIEIWKGHFEHFLQRSDTDPAIADLLLDQMRSEPQFMSTWMICLKKEQGITNPKRGFWSRLLRAAR